MAAYGDHPHPHPTWLTPAAFLSPDFSPSAYTSSLCSSFVPLQTLASGLRSHHTSLKSYLIRLLDRNFNDFVALGNRHAGAAADAAPRVRNPLQVFCHKEVAPLRTATAAQLLELRAAMERRAAASALSKLLQRMLDAFRLLSTVEKLIKLLPTTPSDFSQSGLDSAATDDDSLQNFESATAGGITQSILLERIASQMNRLKYYIGDEKNLPFFQNMEKRIQVVTSILENSLEQCFVQGLEHRHMNAMYNCLRAYAAVDNTSTAEALFRKTVVSPLIKEIIPYSSNHQPEAFASASYDILEGDYQQIMQCIEKDCNFILKLCFQDPGLHDFDFLANSILKEVLFAIQKGKPGAFSPGKPNEFLKNYKSSLAFLAFLEGYCSTKSAIARFRSETVYAEFMKQWNVGVYFSLRFQQIARDLDSSLTGPIKPVKSGGTTPRLLLKQSMKLLESLKKIWSDDVLAFSHADKFLRLSLQLLSRYTTWLSTGLHARRACSGDADWASAPVEDFVYVLHDVFALTGLLSEDFLMQVSQLLSPCSDDTVQVVRKSIVQAGQSLEKLVPLIFDIMTESIVKKSVENLSHVKGLPMTCRITNKLPVRPSPYISGILGPLKVFVEGEHSAYLTKNATQKLLLGSAGNITKEYHELVIGIIRVARENENSLQKVRLHMQQRVGVKSGTSGNNISDTEKLCMQLSIDIQEYGRNLAAIGIKASDIASYRSLWQCVAPEEEQSVIAL